MAVTDVELAGREGGRKGGRKGRHNKCWARGIRGEVREGEQV